MLPTARTCLLRSGFRASEHLGDFGVAESLDLVQIQRCALSWWER